MNETPYLNGSAIINLDVCLGCFAVWFDSGELEEMPETSSTTQVKDLPLAARKAIALASLQHMAELKKSEIMGDDFPDKGWKIVPAILGLPVAIDSRTMSRIPTITYSLILFTSAVSLLSFPHLSASIRDFGFSASEPFRHYGATFITSFFLHADWLHLLLNMYCFGFFGPSVEMDLGSKKYFSLIFFSTIGACFAAILMSPQGNVIGASGGIFGIMIYNLLRFPFKKYGLFFSLRWVSIPGYILFLIYIAYEFIGLFKNYFHADYVAHYSHLGGAAAGLIFFFLFHPKIKAEDTWG
ncbi:MAG: rhomboid family intramembrane serine protease [Pseudobdellovibrionaceae bacterium]